MKFVRVDVDVALALNVGRLGTKAARNPIREEDGRGGSRRRRIRRRRRRHFRHRWRRVVGVVVVVLRVIVVVVILMVMIVMGIEALVVGGIVVVGRGADGTDAAGNADFGRKRRRDAVVGTAPTNDVGDQNEDDEEEDEEDDDEGRNARDKEVVAQTHFFVPVAGSRRR